MSAEINKLNRAQASGALTVLPGVMQQLTGDFIAAKSQAATLGAQLYQTSDGLLGVAGDPLGVNPTARYRPPRASSAPSSMNSPQVAPAKPPVPSPSSCSASPASLPPCWLPSAALPH